MSCPPTTPRAGAPFISELVKYLAVVFPIFDGLDFGPFLWKALLFGLCWYVNSIRPMRYVLSTMFVLALLPALMFNASVSQQDPVGLLVRLYLSWMCAEVSFQSAAAEPDERIYGWWSFPIVLLILL